LKRTPKATSEHFANYQQLKEGVNELRMRLSGDPIRRRLNESTTPSISGRVGQVIYGHWNTRQAPTQTFKDNLVIATRDFAQFKADWKSYLQDLEKYEASIEMAGAPYTKGRKF